MKKLMFTTIFCSMAIVAGSAMAQTISKGDVQRLNLDQITIDSTVVTSSGAELNILDGVTSTATEINRASDVSARNVQLTGNSETLTEASHDGKLIYVSATGGNQAITLPDGGTATGGVYTILFGSAGTPSGDYAVTIAVPSGDNSSFVGSVRMANETDTIVYSSSAVLGGTDTLTFNSSNTEAGDWITIVSAQDTSFVLDGSVRFESAGEDSVLIFSSAVTSTD